MLADIQKQNTAGASPPVIGAFVVYDLPNRDCAAAASNGEYSVSDDGLTHYEAYIDSIVSQLKAYSDVDVALVIGECRSIRKKLGEMLTTAQSLTVSAI